MLARSLAATLLLGLAAHPAAAQTLDFVKAAIPQRGSWETSPADIGQVKGIFARHGIKTETLYTSGGGETMQALISGSVDIAIGTGTAAVMAAFSKGAPARPIASSITGAQDIFWYVPADSPIKTLKDAAGKTIAFSAVGSSSNLATLTLIRQAGVEMKAVPAGVSAATARISTPDCFIRPRVARCDDDPVAEKAMVLPAASFNDLIGESIGTYQKGFCAPVIELAMGRTGAPLAKVASTEAVPVATATSMLPEISACMVSPPPAV